VLKIGSARARNRGIIPHSPISIPILFVFALNNRYQSRQKVSQKTKIIASMTRVENILQVYILTDYSGENRGRICSSFAVDIVTLRVETVGNERLRVWLISCVKLSPTGKQSGIHCRRDCAAIHRIDIDYTSAVAAHYSHKSYNYYPGSR